MINLKILTSNSLTVARYTFLDIYKSKVMINVLFLGIVLVGLCFVASEFTYGVPEKVALEFGFGMVTISAVSIAIFMGATLLSQEISSRTVYLVLSRPISRQSFILGKFLGMALILLIDVFFLGGLSLAFFKYLGGELDWFIVISLLFMYIESLIVLLTVIFFTLFNNITLSIIFTIAVYFAGHSLEKIILFLFSRDIIMTSILVVISYFIPNLSKLNLKDNVLYQKYLEPEIFLQIMGYGIFCILILLCINMFLFSRKNID